MVKKRNLNVDKSARLAQNFDMDTQKWKKVKLGKIIKTDDGAANLEELLGLEVLENYDPNLVSTVSTFQHFL